MRIHRTIQFLTIVATFTACSSPANSAAAAVPDAAPAADVPAPAPAPVAQAGVAVNLRWDSAPLDADYRRQRADLDALHVRERAAPRAGETTIQINTRQASESKALELRYTQGKTAHARTLPPDER